MMIVFIYDTARCCKEEDDPAEAVLYFHPAWVSLTQRLALAGQLMGVHHFLATSFSAPSSITLQGGKFVLKRFGQYVLVSARFPFQDNLKKYIFNIYNECSLFSNII